MYGRSRMTIDPRIPTMSGRSTSGLHRAGRHCLHQARSAERCWASRTKGGLHSTWYILSRTAFEGTPRGGERRLTQVNECNREESKASSLILTRYSFYLCCNRLLVLLTRYCCTYAVPRVYPHHCDRSAGQKLTDCIWRAGHVACQTPGRKA